MAGERVTDVKLMRLLARKEGQRRQPWELFVTDEIAAVDEPAAEVPA